MIILWEQERLNIARIVAKALHHGQVDKVGEPYFNHVDRVSNACTTIPAKIVALFHDVYEDGKITESELSKFVFLTGHEIYCIKLLSKRMVSNLSIRHCFMRCDEHGGYIEAVKDVPIAREVKIADLRDNLDVGRFTRTRKALVEKDIERFRKYERQLSYLLSEDTEYTYKEVK